jgi:hypothetical protein
MVRRGGVCRLALVFVSAGCASRSGGGSSTPPPIGKWTLAAAGLPSEIVLTLAVDRADPNSDPNTVYVGTIDGRVYRSVTGGG